MLILKMVTSLEEKLARVSQSFPDQSLRFLFLINNTCFIGQQVQHDLTRKIDWYIESYLQVSWAPVLKCLRNPTFDCFKINYSPLPKFESNFLKKKVRVQVSHNLRCPKALESPGPEAEEKAAYTYHRGSRLRWGPSVLSTTVAIII